MNHPCGASCRRDYTAKYWLAGPPLKARPLRQSFNARTPNFRAVALSLLNLTRGSKINSVEVQGKVIGKQILSFVFGD
jgi:hypothetical protein